jgi:hypothetical protein
MLGGKGKGGRVGQRESPSGTEVSPCLRVANLQKIFFIYVPLCAMRYYVVLMKLMIYANVALCALGLFAVRQHEINTI